MSSQTWNLEALLDAVGCITTVPQAFDDYTCPPLTRIRRGAPRRPLQPGPQAKNFYLLFDPEQDRAIREGIYEDWSLIKSQLPNGRLENTRFTARGFATEEEARNLWRDLCARHHQCRNMVQEKARKDAELAKPRLLLVELLKLYPSLLQLPPFNLAFAEPAHSGRRELARSPNLIASPPSTPRRNVPEQAEEEPAPPPYTTSERDMGEWQIWLYTPDGVTRYTDLRRAYRALGSALAGGMATLLLAVDRACVDHWSGEA
ncbi:hypothetical protein VNI00_019112 [Paramarasmius palmivorus]|uniref:Uncharacterized protein n=1 Tax=Paramarasmius palmivorus TaxID=297713 RepID=A0AAW0AQD2_9AGAR